MVTTDRYVFTRFYFRAALTDNDHTRTGSSAVSEFYSEIFWV
jgi:hypothetical protein